jgi:hypothetical protein
MQGSQRMMVIATDYESENEMVGAEIQSKVTQLDGGYFFLSAGTHTRAAEFIGVCSSLLSCSSVQSFYELLRTAVTTQKNNLADEYVSGQLGISYVDFVATGKEKLPEEIFREMISSVRTITLGCSLLAVDFSSDEPSIYRIQETGMVEMCDNFAAVGSGLYIAESVLFIRTHTEQDGLQGTLFEVFEAMNLGGRAPGVGDTFTLLVLSRRNGDIVIQQPTPTYGKHVKSTVDKYSMRGYIVKKLPALRNIKTSEAITWGIRIKKTKPAPQSASQKSAGQP